VHITLYVPHELTPEERKLLEQLAHSPNLTPPDRANEQPRPSKRSFWRKVRPTRSP
jgi:hypothetical protein